MEEIINKLKVRKSQIVKEIGKLRDELNRLDKAMVLLSGKPIKETKPIESTEKRYFKRNKKWANDEIERLLELDRNGVSPSQIAKLMGRTARGVRLRLYAEKKRTVTKRRTIAKRPYRIWTKNEEQMLEGMWNNGYSIESISNRLKKDTGQVYQKAFRMKLPKREKAYK